MKLDMVGIITKNMEQALAFYQVLGFTPLGQHSEDYMELANDGVRISLNSRKMVAGIYGHSPMTVGDTIELAFLCDSPEEVDALHAKVVAAGYQSFKEPWCAFWGQRYLPKIDLIYDSRSNGSAVFLITSSGKKTKSRFYVQSDSDNLK